MKYVKMLGLAACAAALMAFVFAGTASATMLYSNAGHTATVGEGAALSAEAETEVILHPPIGEIKCKAGSGVSGTITAAGSSGNPVSGSIPKENLTWKECNADVTTLAGGTLSASLIAGSQNASLSSTGAEVTVEFAGFHCIFTTNATPLGTVTASSVTGATATLDINAEIPRTGGRSSAFCGSKAKWTGSYKVTNPDYLDATDS